MNYVVAINGELIEPEQAKISIFDHGFLFGDSVYEVVRTVEGRILAWQPHVDRLFKSASGISMQIPFAAELLYQEARMVLANCQWPGQEAYLRFIITRGVGELSLDPTSCKVPNRIFIAKPMPRLDRESYDNGIRLELVERQRNSKESTNPNVKSGNYLNNVLAFAEANQSGAKEAIMLNQHGQITECTTANIFLVKAGVVMTPALHCGLLAGITRQLILDGCENSGIDYEEAELYPEDLWSAEEVFISSSTRDIVPVKTVNSTAYKVPGSTTAKVQTAFNTEREKYLDSERALNH